MISYGLLQRKGKMTESGDQVETSKLDYVLLTATEGEQAILREAVANPEIRTVARRQAIFGRIAGNDVALVATGIGLVNTAQTLTGLFETMTVRRVIQLGIGGAYPSSGLEVGDIAAATEEISAEYGVAGDDGWSDGRTIGIPLVETEPPTFNHIALDKAFSDRALRSAQTLASQSNCNARSGPFVTVQTVTGSDIRAHELDTRFNALCENMEGAASAQVCSIYNIPMAEIRGISNIVEKRDLARWNIPLAAKRAQEAALALLADA